LNKQSKEQLILEILDSVRNDVISEYMVKEIIQKYTDNEKLSEIKAKIIVDKHKRMNGLRQKIEKIEQSKGDELQNVFDFIDFATYMTNDFSKYSSCRKIYFFTEKFNEKENAYKVKVKK
jgi:coenzyme F420-reducing hydrogenase alpha subunit